MQKENGPRVARYQSVGIFQKQPLEVVYKKGVLRSFAKFTGHQKLGRVFGKPGR